MLSIKFLCIKCDPKEDTSCINVLYCIPNYFPGHIMSAFHIFHNGGESVSNKNRQLVGKDYHYKHLDK